MKKSTIFFKNICEIKKMYVPLQSLLSQMAHSSIG